MAQEGYISCPGCGRLFKVESQLERADFILHNCDEYLEEDEAE
jgi:uncharacterized C2H2 Zn-finger protein